MLSPTQRLAIYMQDTLGEREGKMGYGVLRYAPNPVACVIDSRHAGREVREVVDLPRSCPVVADTDAARALGAEVLVLGIAPSGGRLPDEWVPAIRAALAAGMSLVNGLHDRLATRFNDTVRAGAWIWDVRAPVGENPPIAAGRARELDNKRVLMLGTDMAVGKMTAGLELQRWLQGQGADTVFLATGQIGMVVTGGGIPLDAYKVDLACGAVERMVLRAREHAIVIVEGQGSLLHPGSTATLPLLRGTCPTHLVFCHRAGRETLARVPWVRIPPLAEFIRLNQEVCACCGALPRAQSLGVCLDTSRLPEPAARAAVRRLEQELNLPVTDPVRFGVAGIGERLL